MISVWPTGTKHDRTMLSGGQQQRVAIARAIVTDPAIVLADEPTGALDSRSGEMVMDLLGTLNAQGRTVVLITHDTDVAARAQRRIHVRDGLIETIESTVPAGSSRPANRAERGMSILAIIRLALGRILASRVRSFLTMLGVIIGVASLVALTSVVSGATSGITASLSDLGAKQISVAANSSKALTESDADSDRRPSPAWPRSPPRSAARAPPPPAAR